MGNRRMLEPVLKRGMKILTDPRASKIGTTVAFTGRDGGVSKGPYSSLNLSYNVGDDWRDVRDNRKKVGEFLGVDPNRWVLCQQVHGARVARAGPLEKGRGGLDYWSALPRTDALITRTPGIAIGVLTADCMPVILVAPGSGWVGIAHAGWRGVLAGVVAAALKELVGRSGCLPSEVAAYAGPHIGPCCFEVGDEVSSRFKEKYGDETVSSKEGTSKVDLYEAVSRQLVRKGMLRERVVDSGICTVCGEGYFSYRASSGLTGRQAGLVAVG